MACTGNDAGQMFGFILILRFRRNWHLALLQVAVASQGRSLRHS